MTFKRSTSVKACAYIWKQQDRFIFMPQRIITSTPANYQLPFEDLYIRIKEEPVSNEKLHAWFIPAAGQSVRRVLLYLHGSALNIGANLDHAQRFRNLGLSVFLLSYRGYGRSDGVFPSEKSVYVDAETAWNYLTADRKFEPLTWWPRPPHRWRGHH